jgi:hypothetical protein
VNRALMRVVLMLVVLLSLPLEGRAAQRKLVAIDLKGEGSARWLLIKTDSPANFTSFKLGHPARVVVDFPETIAIASKQAGPETGTIAGWSVQPLGVEPQVVTRVTVELRRDADYTVTSSGNAVELRLVSATARPLFALENEHVQAPARVVEPPPVAVAVAESAPKPVEAAPSVPPTPITVAALESSAPVVAPPSGPSAEERAQTEGAARLAAVQAKKDAEEEARRQVAEAARLKREQQLAAAQAKKARAEEAKLARIAAEKQATQARAARLAEAKEKKRQAELARKEKAVAQQAQARAALKEKQRAAQARVEKAAAAKAEARAALVAKKKASAAAAAQKIADARARAEAKKKAAEEARLEQLAEAKAEKKAREDARQQEAAAQAERLAAQKAATRQQAERLAEEKSRKDQEARLAHEKAEALEAQREAAAEREKESVLEARRQLALRDAAERAAKAEAQPLSPPLVVVASAAPATLPVERPEKPSRPAVFEQMGFRRVGTGAEIVLHTNVPVAYAMREDAAGKLVLGLEHTRITLARNKLALDTSYFGTPVARVVPHDNPRENRVEVEFDLSSPAPYEIKADGGTVTVLFRAPPVVRAEADRAPSMTAEP